ncbi:hypothetical protein E143388_02866 [Rhodococcus opacus]|nr:hypothetical protein E143388_02866 [Rhodococcus opacus]
MPLPPAHGEPLDDRQQLENGEQPRLGIVEIHRIRRRNRWYWIRTHSFITALCLKIRLRKANSIGQALRTMSKNLDVGISTQVDRLCQNFSADQNPDHQVDALRRAGVAAENIHVDHAGGTKASRPELVLVLKRFRGGDVLVITRLDRLGRSMLHLITLGTDLRERGIGLNVLEQEIDTATAECRAMFGMRGPGKGGTGTLSGNGDKVGSTRPCRCTSPPTTLRRPQGLGHPHLAHLRPPVHPSTETSARTAAATTRSGSGAAGTEVITATTGSVIRCSAETSSSTVSVTAAM